MNEYHHHSHNKPQAFTLIESVIAVGIVATVVLALMGLIPAGLEASREATLRSLVAVIQENVHDQLKGFPLTPNAAAQPGPFFYNEQGLLISRPDDPAPDSEQAFFRVDVTLSVPHASHLPPHTSGLTGITLAISWPVNANGDAVGNRNPQSVISYYSSPLSGPQWTEIDANYTPKLEF